jgi:hypothetical protein
MAWILTIMLSFSNEECWKDDEDEPVEPLECKPMEQINNWVSGGNPSSSDWGRLVELISPTYVDDASYGMDANLVGGGFRHFNIEGFIKVIEDQNWKEREAVQLWLKGEEDEMFTLIKLWRMPKSSKANQLPARRKTSLRRDSSVGSGERAIEKAFGLPRESVWLVNPDRRKARSDKRVGTLLDDWGKQAKKRPIKMTAVKIWTMSELSILRKEYPHTETKALAKKLGRTLEAVRFQAKKHSLKKTKSYMKSLYKSASR